MKSSVVKRMGKDIVSGSFVPANAGMFLFLVCVLFLPSESFGGHHEQGRYDATNGYGERYELVFSDQDGGSWGQSVAISGDVAVAGSGEDNSVYVFDRNSDGTWSQSQKFSSSAEDTRFGEAVAISGGTIVVGDHYEESVTVYERSTNGVWLQSQKLSSSVVADTNFGQSVAISGDKMIVGEDSEDSAYIYEKNSTGTWVLKQKFTVSVSSRDFGYSVAISGNRAIVGAPTAKTFCEDGADAAYVYERNAAGTWSQSQVLTTGGENLRCLTSSGFGHDVGISGDSLIVGSSSASHIFERNAEGNYVLTKTTSHTSARRGYIVALSGDKALTGSQSGVMIRVMKKADRVWLTNSWILHMRDLETATRLSKKYKVTDAGISGDRAIVLFGNSSDEMRMFVYELTEAGTARTQPVVNEEGPEAGTDPGTPGGGERPEEEPGETGTLGDNGRPEEEGSPEAPNPATGGPGGAPGTGEPPGGVEGAGHLEDILSRNGNAPGGQLSQSGGCAISGGNEPAGGALSALATLMLTLTPLSVGRFRERGKRFPSEKQSPPPV